MAVYVPWLEVTTGLTLLIGVWRREALTVALLVCATFFIANVSAMVRGLDIDCGCFGAGYHGSALRETLIVSAMLAAAVVALRLSGSASIKPRDGAHQRRDRERLTAAKGRGEP
jgi:hypothetical protein